MIWRCMADQKIEPPKVTKPIQLLAAWLVGLVLIDGAFLSSAAIIAKPEWASGALVVSAIFNVSLFLGCLFLLQTRFRPEMQEDQYYATYLEKRYSVETARIELVEVKRSISALALESEAIRPKIIRSAIRSIPGQGIETRVQINDLLPRYRELRTELEKKQIMIESTFGSSSVGKPHPSLFVVAIGADADLSVADKIIKVSKNFGLDGISYAKDEINRGDIYVGAYGYDQLPYLPRTSKTFRDLKIESWDTLLPILTGSSELTRAAE